MSPSSRPGAGRIRASADGRSLPAANGRGLHRAAVLGHPVDHSLSPVLHRAAYRGSGLRDWTYERYDVTADRLVGFVTALDDSWRGLSLTMPLKEPAFQVATQVGELADAVGAINTLVRTDAGWAGENTDVHGLIAALGEVGAHDLADLPHRGGRQRGHGPVRAGGDPPARRARGRPYGPRRTPDADRGAGRRWALALGAADRAVAGPARRRGEHGAARGHGRGGASVSGWWSGTGRGCLR